MKFTRRTYAGGSTEEIVQIVRHLAVVTFDPVVGVNIVPPDIIH